MRDCVKNKQTIYWSRFVDVEPKLKDGVATGSYIKVYSDPIEIKVNIASVVSRNGVYTNEQYGAKFKHDKLITTSKDLGIKTEDKFWVGIPTTSDANYVVSGIYPSKNVIVIGLNMVV